MKVYLARDNVQAGPYSLDELNRMLASGEVLLTDLMWHSGMAEWQTVAEKTGGLLVYQPTTIDLSKLQDAQRKVSRGFGDNVDFYPPNQETDTDKDNRRISVAELYGRAPTAPAPTESAPINITLAKPTEDTKIEYAGVGVRFLAMAINLSLYILTLLPLIMAFVNIINPDEIAKLTDYASMQAYSQSLVPQVSKTNIMMSNVMLLALIGVQLLLIAKRGQSLGKLATGIRVVDVATGKLPKLSNLVFMRTILVVVAYALGASLLSGLPAIVMLSTNYLMANKDAKKQGWHDKMTNTMVVKAKPNQLQR